MKKVTDRKLSYFSNKLQNHKVDKHWLAVPLATASIVAGLTFTNHPVKAATNATNDEPTTNEQSGTESENTDTTATKRLKVVTKTEAADATAAKSSTAVTESGDTGSTDDSGSKTDTESGATDSTDDSGAKTDTEPETTSSTEDSSSKTDTEPETTGSTEDSSSKTVTEPETTGSTEDSSSKTVTEPEVTGSTDNSGSKTDTEPETTGSTADKDSTVVTKPEVTDSSEKKGTTDETNQLSDAKIDTKSFSQLSALSDNLSAEIQQPMSFDASVSTDNVSAMPTARDIGDVIPDLANFYITVNSNIVLYNAKASAAILPYATNHMTANDPLFGFYIVLPISITGNLAEFQTGADNYVKAQKQSTDIALSSLTVSQLGNTTDGRQVFYFRPDDNAHVTTPDPDITSGGTSNAQRIRLELPISTGADVTSTPKTITINAGNDAEVPVSDVLFAGIGDKVSTEPLYKTIASSDLGIVAPDKNIVGISYTNASGLSNAKTLTYTHVNVTDSYIAWDNDTDAKIGYDPMKISAQDGTTYDRSKVISDLLAINKYFSASKYWYPSMTISEDPSTDTSAGTLTDTMVLRPTELQASGNSVPGKTYYVRVNEIKTKLTGDTSKTINAGEAATWNPDDNISIIAPNGKSIKISDMTGSGTNLSKPGTYTYTDADNNVLTIVSSVDPTKAGAYKVEYKYTDAQGNTGFINGNTGATGAKSIIENIVVNDSSAISASDQDIIAGQYWSLSNGVTSITDSNGIPVDPSTAWGTSLTATDSDGNVITSIDTAEAGTKTVTYHYTDPTTGKVVDSDPVTITIADNDGQLETQYLNIKKGSSWTPMDSIKSITDSDGTAVTDFSKATITESYFTSDGKQISEIDTSKPGQYIVEYSYTDSIGVTHHSSTQLNVIQDSLLSTQDTTVTVGKTWNPADNIASITDSFGNQVSVDQAMNSTLVYKGDVDTSKAGDYKVTYTYKDDFTTISQDTIVHVIVDNSQITLPDMTSKPSAIVSGPNMSSWHPMDGVTLVDDHDPEVTASSAFSKGKLTYEIVGQDGTPVTADQLDESTPAGVYEVTYTYVDSLGNKLVTSTTVTINASGLDVVASDKTITAGTSWNPTDNITSLNDESGNDVTSSVKTALQDGSLKISMTDATGNTVSADQLDTSKSGAYNITYTFKDSVGNVKTATSKLTINPKSSGGSGSDSGTDTGDNSGNGTGDSDSGSGSDTDNNSGNSTGNSGAGSGTSTDNNSGNSTSDSGTGSGSGSNTGSGDNSSDNQTDNSNSDSGNSSITLPGNNSGVEASGNTVKNTGVGSSNASSNVTNKPASVSTSSTTTSPVKINSTQASPSKGNATKHSMNSTDSDSNMGQLPQTGEQATAWYSQLGLFLLTALGLGLLGLLGFKRKKE